MHALGLIETSPPTTASDENDLREDYERVSRWLGAMPFADFAKGYRSMEAWYRTQRFPRTARPMSPPAEGGS